MDNPEARPPLVPPWLFTGQGLLGLALATLVTATLASVEVALLSACLLVVGLAGRGWASAAPRRVGYTRHAPASPRGRALRAFRGDSLLLETSLGNRKPLPLPWAEVWERIPTAFGLPEDLEAERSLVDPAWVWLCQGAALWPYQRARWRLPLECRRRGVFTLGDAHLRTGDPFGLFEHDAAVSLAPLEVIVYPRVVPLRRLALPLRHASLDAVGARSLVPDPTRTAALRAYQPGDPQKLIHWPTTARRGSLQVRVLEPATSLRVCLLVDVRGFRVWPSASAARDDPPFETALAAVASIAVHLLRENGGAQVGLLANAEPPVEVPPGSSPDHLQTLLESLARLSPAPARPLLPWALATGSLPRGGTVVLVAYEFAPDLPTTVAHLEHAGHPVLTLLIGAAADEHPRYSHRVARVSSIADLAGALEGLGG